jgi:hypothetical protein
MVHLIGGDFVETICILIVAEGYPNIPCDRRIHGEAEDAFEFLGVAIAQTYPSNPAIERTDAFEALPIFANAVPAEFVVFRRSSKPPKRS